MTKSARLHLTVVVPAYNEADLISKCLTPLTQQTRPIDEIIVVDNNSRDNTGEIAASFPGVTVIKEKRQGVTYAKYTGFDRANGEIIAQLDADSIVTPTWCEQLMEAFESDPGVAGVAGSAAIAELSPEGKFWFQVPCRMFRAWEHFSLGVKPVMFGYNCALRREAWQEIRHMVTIGKPIADDIEVTICLLKTGKHILYLPKLIVKIHIFRSLVPKKQRGYFLRDNATLAKHQYGNRLRRKIAR